MDTDLSRSAGARLAIYERLSAPVLSHLERQGEHLRKLRLPKSRKRLACLADWAVFMSEWVQVAP